MTMLDKPVMVAVILMFLLIVFLTINAVREKRMEIKRENALEHLLEATDEVFFYGRRVSTCIEIGAVRTLICENIGDFAKVFGELVMYALFTHGNEASWMYWRYSPREDDSMPEHNSVFVVFEHDGEKWRLDVCGRYLDQVNFRLLDQEFDKKYKVWTYLGNVPRGERYSLENCTDRERSNLRPDIRYKEMDSEELAQEIDRVLKGSKPWLEY